MGEIGNFPFIALNHSPVAFKKKIRTIFMQYGPKNLLMKERKLDNLPTECILEFSVKNM